MSENEYQIDNNGKLIRRDGHDEDKPTISYTDQYGYRHDIWLLNGMLHRVSGPAAISYFPDGKISSTAYYRNHMHYRDGGLPTEELFDNAGNLIGYSYHDENDDLHREGAPAQLTREGTETWAIHGKKHRLDGPAVIYNRNGKPSALQYWVNGIRKDSV